MKHHPLREILSGYARVFHAIKIAFRTPRVVTLLSLTMFVAVTFALVIMVIEGWGLVDAFYFAVVSMATVGYGDLAPQTTPGKLITIGFLLVGIGIFVLTVGAIAEAVLSALRQGAHGNASTPAAPESDDTQSKGRGPKA
jgi:voltage-gated potassium channel